ncbi:IS3 family transposase [Arthrobacter sp. CAN_A214]|uniref:IS3 family transposase n=1 Tax=Arthrobacter sp. CAN_A214 TaxID=2787720 RepID=UPI0018CA7FCA
MADYVRLIHQQSGGTYGWRRIRAELLDEYEMIVNRKLIKAIMIEHEIAGVPRAGAFRHALVDKRTDADLVNRIFTTDGPNRLWLTDVTEHPTREGKVYCCVVLDCFARTAVSRSFSTINDTALVNRASPRHKEAGSATEQRSCIRTTERTSPPGDSARTFAPGTSPPRWAVPGTVTTTR